LYPRSVCSSELDSANISGSDRARFCLYNTLRVSARVAYRLKSQHNTFTIRLHCGLRENVAWYAARRMYLKHVHVPQLCLRQPLRYPVSHCVIPSAIALSRQPLRYPVSHCVIPCACFCEKAHERKKEEEVLCETSRRIPRSLNSPL
jgi:hypothetical protein